MECDSDVDAGVEREAARCIPVCVHEGKLGAESVAVGVGGAARFAAGEGRGGRFD